MTIRATLLAGLALVSIVGALHACDSPPATVAPPLTEAERRCETIVRLQRFAYPAGRAYDAVAAPELRELRASCLAEAAGKH